MKSWWFLLLFCQLLNGTASKDTPLWFSKLCSRFPWMVCTKSEAGNFLIEEDLLGSAVKADLENSEEKHRIAIYKNCPAPSRCEPQHRVDHVAHPNVTVLVRTVKSADGVSIHEEVSNLRGAVLHGAGAAVYDVFNTTTKLPVPIHNEVYFIGFANGENGNIVRSELRDSIEAVIKRGYQDLVAIYAKILDDPTNEKHHQEFAQQANLIVTEVRMRIRWMLTLDGLIIGFARSMKERGLHHCNFHAANYKLIPHKFNSRDEIQQAILEGNAIPRGNAVLNSYISKPVEEDALKHSAGILEAVWYRMVPETLDVYAAHFLDITPQLTQHGGDGSKVPYACRVYRSNRDSDLGMHHWSIYKDLMGLAPYAILKGLRLAKAAESGQMQTETKSEVAIPRDKMDDALKDCAKWLEMKSGVFTDLAPEWDSCKRANDIFYEMDGSDAALVSAGKMEVPNAPCTHQMEIDGLVKGQRVLDEMAEKLGGDLPNIFKVYHPAAQRARSTARKNKSVALRSVLRPEAGPE